MQPRLTSKVRVAALIRQAQTVGAFATVVYKGEMERGTILVKHLTGQGLGILYEAATDLDGEFEWRPYNADPIAEAEMDAEAEKRHRFDRDLWLVDIDDPHSRLILKP